MFFQENTYTVCLDEMPSLQAIERIGKPKPAEPNRPIRMEYEYIRHGTTCVIGNWDVVNGQLICPTISATYDSQSLLQSLLAKYPNLLAGEQMDAKNPRRWILISQEFGVPGEQDGSNRWSLEHSFIDQDGIPTLVEVMRSRDTRIRREVVGQMLDDAANAVLRATIAQTRRSTLFRARRNCYARAPYRVVQGLGTNA